MPVIDLLICVRCHRWADLILDTVDSIQAHTDRKTTRVVCAVDGGSGNVPQVLAQAMGEANVYAARNHYGWGAGLQALLLESMEEFGRRFRYEHFMSVDYDTYFIQKGVDEALLNHIIDPSIGLLGNYTACNHHWAAVLERCRGNLISRFGAIPRTYSVGEGVQGGGFIVTRRGRDEFRKRGMYAGPWANPQQFTTIADDHLITLYTRYAGLEVAALNDEKFHFTWRATGDPKRFAGGSVMAFHPTKVGSGSNAVETERPIRNFYRNLRGREPLR